MDQGKPAPVSQQSCGCGTKLGKGTPLHPSGASLPARACRIPGRIGDHQIGSKVPVHGPQVPGEDLPCQSVGRQIFPGLPGGDGVRYMVNICHGSSPITEGLEDFEVCSEHYYLHVDPAIEVLAATRFPVVPYYHSANKAVDMPVAWTKYWGNGRVFYTSLGHHDDIFDKFPNAQILMERGMLWAGEGKSRALARGLTAERFEKADR